MTYTIKHTPLVAAMLLALNSPLAQAAFGDSIGNEFAVNTEVTGNQFDSSIAMDADGDFVITWNSDGQDGSGFGIYAQRYNADGTEADAEFPVNTFTLGDQDTPSVAMDADGDFIITWRSVDQDGNGLGIYAQRYNADGSKAGNEFIVNTTTANDQDLPGIAMDADGDFVITWGSFGQEPNATASFGVYAQRYNADGSKAGNEFQVNTFTTGSQSTPSIAMNAGGDFVIAWNSFEQDGNILGIFAQRYNADGITAGAEFAVNTITTLDQQTPGVAMDADGDFVITWRSQRNAIGVPEDLDVYARRYNADGSAADAVEFKVNATTIGKQSDASVAMDASGDFVITWSSDDPAGVGFEAYRQRYNADGSRQGGELIVNTTTADDQLFPSIAMDADGDFVIAWSSGAGVNNDILAQRYLGADETINLNLVMQDDTDPATAGVNFVYSLMTTNNGTGIALDVNLTMPLPTGLTYVSDDATSSGWNCAVAATDLVCHKPFMNAGTMMNTINVTVKATSEGTLNNTVTVSTAQTDTNPADNTDTETTEVDAAPPTPPSSGSSGGSLGLGSLLLFLPLWLRRQWLR